MAIAGVIAAPGRAVTQAPWAQVNPALQAKKFIRLTLAVISCFITVEVVVQKQGVNTLIPLFRWNITSCVTLHDNLRNTQIKALLFEIKRRFDAWNSLNDINALSRREIFKSRKRFNIKAQTVKFFNGKKRCEPSSIL
ncbi:hypothetical protein D3C80_1597140 [compost metagenome]